MVQLTDACLHWSFSTTWRRDSGRRRAISETCGRGSSSVAECSFLDTVISDKRVQPAGSMPSWRMTWCSLAWCRRPSQVSCCLLPCLELCSCQSLLMAVACLEESTWQKIGGCRETSVGLAGQWNRKWMQLHKLSHNMLMIINKRWKSGQGGAALKMHLYQYVHMYPY